MKIKKNDNVIVIAGEDKGKTGKVLAVFKNQNRALVEGVNLKKKNQRATKAGQKGQVIEKAMPIHISNLALSADGKPSRVGYKLVGDKKVRIVRKTGKEI